MWVALVLASPALARPPLLAEIAAGSLGGAVKTALFYPLDTLTTKAEAKRGALGAAEPGARALYRGLGVSLLCGLPYACVFHTANSYAACCLSVIIPAAPVDATTALAAAIASFVATVVGVPLEYLKHRAQVRAPGFESLAASLGTVRAEPSQLYTGFCTTLARNVPYNALHFSLFAAFGRLLRALFPARQAPALGLLCGALTGATVSFLTHPFDLLNTRRQVGTALGRERTANVVTSLELLARREGTTALFRGWRPRCFQYTAAGTVFFGVYSAVLERWPHVG
ncbi:hypothetical protein KFE25_006337 [Diacronema lutheri]|uniref:Uncharacterized protein n=1 Tax=Diacronema lutheri TaxID=2081491 RepID=A0A8J6CCG9_DIALT|nr:hypothetical protein KFE25_006337 [Diacronema lutheri]